MKYLAETTILSFSSHPSLLQPQNFIEMYLIIIIN